MKDFNRTSKLTDASGQATPQTFQMCNTTLRNN